MVDIFTSCCYFMPIGFNFSRLASLYKTLFRCNSPSSQSLLLRRPWVYSFAECGSTAASTVTSMPISFLSSSESVVPSLM